LALGLFPERLAVRVPACSFRTGNWSNVLPATIPGLGGLASSINSSVGLSGSL